jgi:putative DNA primase/helicase
VTEVSPEAYAVMGWRVFPCHTIVKGKCTCGKGSECASPGKHPRTSQGVKNASNDVATIQAWREQWPESNWALACGRESGVVVIDIDPRHNGYESIEEYENARPEGNLPKTLRATSGGGGRHLIFKYPDGVTSVSNRQNWLPGVDIKADGGYIILPPSEHISGGKYSWDKDYGWGKTNPLPMPADVLLAISKPTPGGSTREGLSDTANILDGVPEGKRDDILFRWACRLRRQHENDDDGGRAAVTALVLHAAARSTPPFPEKEARAKVDQAFKQDHSDSDLTLESYDIHPMTDVGNKERFIDMYESDILYVKGGGWVRWTGIKWEDISDQEILHMAEQVHTSITRDISRVDSTDTVRRKQLTAWRKVTQSTARIAAIEKTAQTDPRLLRDMSQFDAVPHLLACRDAVIDLRSGTTRSASPDDLITKTSPVLFKKEFDPSPWRRFLETVTDGDEELLEYLQLAAGYTLTGSNKNECLFIVSGPPASGKSTFMEALHEALGDYATTTQSDTLMYRHNRDAPKDEIARMAGVRYVGVSEIRSGESFNEVLIKQITGGDKITGRFLYRDTFQYRPQMKLWIGTNHEPSTSDKAMMRRLKRIVFPHTVPVEKRDPSLKEWVRDPDTGGRAVLHWAVEGAAKWYEKGLDEPETVAKALKDYAADHDKFGHFLEEHVTSGNGSDVVDVQTAYQTYRGWAESAGERPLSKMQWLITMKERDWVTSTVDGKKVFIGMKLRGLVTWEAGGV